MNNTKNLSAAALLSIGALAFFLACTKNTTPTPPVHDTVTVVKNDTLYASAPDTTVRLTKGLLLYLPFSGNIADSSGNGNPTQAVGGSLLTYDAHGYANSAFGSDGNGARVLVSNNGSIKFDTAYSISLDFMVFSISRQGYLSMVDPLTGNGPSFMVGTNTPNVANLDFGANDITAGCDNSGGSDPNKVNDTTGFVPQLNAWYNVICTYHKDTLQVFVNGSLISTKIGPGSQANLCPASQIVVGGWWNSDPISINGKLDEVRLYNRVLNSHEITQLARNFQITSEGQKPALRTH